METFQDKRGQESVAVVTLHNFLRNYKTQLGIFFSTQEL